MAISRAKQSTVKRSKHAKEFQDKLATGREEAQAEQKALLEAHLPPFGLTVAVLFCSGFLFVFGLRDFLTTGKNIAGSWDDALMVRVWYCAFLRVYFLYFGMSAQVLQCNLKSRF